MADEQHYDIVIVGAGPVGLAVGLYAAGDGATAAIRADHYITDTF